MNRDAVQETIAPNRGVVHSPRRFPIVFVAVAAFAMMAMAFYAPTARWLTHSRGEHLVRADAEGRIQLDLPEGASDIRYYQHSHPEIIIATDFAITEGDFVAWAGRQGWKPKPIVGAITVWPRSRCGDSVTVVKITNGLSYHTVRRGEPNTLSVTYDRGTHRAYFTFNSEPRDEG